ncbi:division/cell wall cluster transcriptional repressor MraZ [Anaerococcus sp.]|mgnify:FL=1|uniref:division/cell wall cluster transcriptional repressor MraZ n=1 Tax=Anaerococcus TaxID=165779 RepID=UPI00257F2D26|nr:division/cell wall cluster transcriptional repressor MraZ [Anaerococcus sp.]MBS6105964.1 division/cell wall cluster transcriptional repressor MraZ [Anaerococcus sp.]MDU2598821.1 division/cell wall cluster transcriptional repressor MraZ [Anaerococcus sp.]MDU3177606.1 division/cell wall cluster transcriptional repressor MraZ [Anaerococcus sp.]MDU5535499.1 division/cell wall cluster transcriptional repressor MraZ [Anaerococcus sp.]MDU7411871.1 division/cell wall cluster transcriptional repress
MFLGEFTHKLDSKNRIMMPSEFRDDLSEEFYITKGPENSLVIYTKDEFERQSLRLDELVNENKKNRAIKRLFFSSTIKTSLDKQGRVLLNKNLRDYAHIESEAMIIGNNLTIEIWDLDLWQGYINEVEVNLSDIMDD